MDCWLVNKRRSMRLRSSLLGAVLWICWGTFALCFRSLPQRTTHDVTSTGKAVFVEERSHQKALTMVLQTDISPPLPLVDKERGIGDLIGAENSAQSGYAPEDDDCETKIGDDEELQEIGTTCESNDRNDKNLKSGGNKGSKGVKKALVREKDINQDEQAWRDAFDSMNSTTLRSIFVGLERFGTTVENFFVEFGLDSVVRKVKDDIRITTRAINDVNRKLVRTSRAASRTAQDLGDSISSFPNDLSKLAAMDRVEAFSLVRMGLNPLQKPKLIGGLENRRIKDKVKAQKRKKKTNALNLAAKMRSLPKQLQYDYKRQVKREALREETVRAGSFKQLSSGTNFTSTEKNIETFELPMISSGNDVTISNQALFDSNTMDLGGDMSPSFAPIRGGLNVSAIPLPYTEPYEKESLLGLVATQSLSKATINPATIDDDSRMNGNGNENDEPSRGEMVDMKLNDGYDDRRLTRDDVEKIGPIKTAVLDSNTSVNKRYVYNYEDEKIRFVDQNIDRLKTNVDMDNTYYDLDAYEILGVDLDADIQTIKKAYRNAVFLWHPDRFPGDTAKQIEGGLRLEVINRAWYCLNDENRRARYDKYGEEGVGTSAAMEADIVESITVEESDLIIDAFKFVVSSFDVSFFLLESLLRAVIPIVRDRGEIARERIRNVYDAKGYARWRRLNYLTKGEEK